MIRIPYIHSLLRCTVSVCNEQCRRLTRFASGIQHKPIPRAAPRYPARCQLEQYPARRQLERYPARKVS